MLESNLCVDTKCPNVLVTGGAGFVGNNFLRYMLQRYPLYHFYNLDVLTYSGNIRNLTDLTEYNNYTFIQANICDREKISSLIQNYKIDVIINFAAESHVDRSIAGPEIFITTNVIGTQSLLEAAVKHQVKLFLQISTDEVYGSLDDCGYFTETSPIAPNNPYSASKASADLLVKAYSNTYGLQSNIVRFGNTYGPSQHPEKLIPMIILSALNNREIPIHGEGLSIRDWVFVSDNNAAIDRVLHDGKRGEVYNIGSREEKRTIDVVHLILELMAKPKSLIKFVQDRPGQDYRYANDPSKIMKELGWKPQVSFIEGLKRTIEWNTQNRHWWTNYIKTFTSFLFICIQIVTYEL